MKLLGKLRNRLKNKKGFTLVELIVVIVIIAILAAILVPSVMKYIDKAKEQQIKADARAIYIAAQTVATEEYAEGTPVADGDVTVTQAKIGKTGLQGEIATLGAIKKTYSAKITFKDSDVDTYVFTQGKKTATYDGEKWVIGNTAP
ncbi:prepilin-type N-terminal cleavage/methylation domain-containing protein [Ohessyouella blattaphilus]|uniref:Prepilin-type N-terminal cleavage/methylation domain-containing protein n=1 Tax=Ohessyouella blattaphilus TaxID=2949333 RepID=A0ABT1EJT1_9FIRM|nr:prepilin-type N-terminal cleavage/methylation domain-containing protein [Ohessyouella blattaphilus]MCP1110960.1 prepilin-type N-terminal cleavage/methylation domain-containing protein [Ohessyouella blattaphilus]MCR8564354.1 prepilin-type N-terminal cleavage/methylation domain-containing protein [Ohessyouella blattaphilus]